MAKTKQKPKTNSSAKIIVIGTSHVSPDSIKQAHDTILREKPDCVAIELCPERFYAMTHNIQRPPSLAHPLHYTLYWLQQHFGKKTGVLPGSEMLTAWKTAKQVKAKTVLIDMDISKIMYKISTVGVAERGKILFKLVSSFFISLIVPGKYGFNLRKVPTNKTIDEAMDYMRTDMPAFYNILVRDRNKHMAKWIQKLSKEHKKIVVVVGAGHKRGLDRIIKSMKKRKAF